MPNTTFERFLGLVKMYSVQIAVAFQSVTAVAVACSPRHDGEDTS